MTLAVLLNLGALAAGVRKRCWAVAVVLGAVGIALTVRMATRGASFEGLAFLSEGILCSCALAVCAAQNLSAPWHYGLGSFPSALFVLLAVLVPDLRDLFRQELLASWNSQREVVAKLGLFASTDGRDSLWEWLYTLAPAYWVLGTLARIWVARRIVLFSRSAAKGLSTVRFVDFRLGDICLWGVVGSLLLEIIGSGQARVIAHNVLLVCGVLYLLQGLAVLHFLFQLRRVPLVYTVAFYAAALLTQLPLILVLVVGILDTWLEFRKRFAKPVPSIENRKETDQWK